MAVKGELHRGDLSYGERLDGERARYSTVGENREGDKDRTEEVSKRNIYTSEYCFE